ncbi:MAG: IS21-like element helper ATPase IstB [Oscillospiraceae bacterium]|jgi:DNA replication protein DnaC|nr:IS21-like element helper ATPase IstB [Oscillospiraceae bacterium]
MNPKITELAVNLKLPYIRDNWRQLSDEAKQTKQDYVAFLENFLDCEWRNRLENGQARRIKEAKFPLKKYLVDFKREKYDELFAPKFEELETLEFINNKENIILMGTSGAGKTHYAIALGISACMKGHSVLFASVPNYIIELKETMNISQMSNYRKRFEKYALVILDELGYLSMDKNGCEMLFNLISSRNDKGSIIVTSNLTFDRWEEVFKDPTLTGALIDRLAHKAHILDISREKGGRFEETIAWLECAKR